MAEIILLRLDGVGVEAAAAWLKTTPKRVSLGSRRFERTTAPAPVTNG
jgi:hypothetical protein